MTIHRTIALLTRSKRAGVPFDQAWRQATNGRPSEVARFAHDSIRRAYLDEPPKPCDQIATVLDNIDTDHSLPAQTRNQRPLAA